MNNIKPQNLIEQENRFQKLFETMNLGVTYQNSKGEIIDANTAATRILGLSLDQMKGKTSLDPNWKAIHEDGSDYTGDTHPSMIALQTGKPVVNKIMGIINSIENEYRWIKIDAIPQFRNGEKKPYQVYTTFDNITLLKKSEFLLKENEKRYVKAQQMGKVGNWEYDFKTNQLWGSAETRRIFGINSRKKNLDIETIESCMVNLDYVRQTTINLIENGEKYTIEFNIKPKNRILPKTVRSKAELVFNKNGEILKIIGVVQDITQRKIVKNKLKESEDKFFKILKNSSNSILLARLSDYKIINLNKSTAKLTGYSLKELKGKNLFEVDLWKSKVKRKNFIERLNKKGKIKNFEASFNIKSGEEKIWLVSGEIINIENEKFVLAIIEDVTIARKTEQALKMQSNFAFTMTEKHPAGIVACNEDGKLVLFNKTAKKWHGINILKIPKEKWAENYGLYNAENNMLLETHEIPLIRAFNGEKIVNVEMIIRAKNQKPRYVLCNGAVFLDKKGNKLGALAIMNDITHQKLNELALKESELEIKRRLAEVEQSEFFLKESAKIAKIGGWGIDLNSQKVIWSEQVFKIHGLPVGKLPSLDEAMSFFVNGSKEILSNAIEESIAKNKKYDLELEFKNALNENLWVNTIGYPITNKIGEVIGLRGVFQDITEQKIIREKIQKNQEMQLLLANNTNDIICLHDSDSTFQYITPSIKNILGYEQHNFIGKKAFQLIHKEDVSILKKMMEQKKSYEAFRFRALHKKGHYVWLEFLATPIYKGSEIKNYVTSTRDITRWVLANERIQKYQNSLQKLTNEITLIEEKQKRQIASNIHDNLSQALVISKMKIGLLKKNKKIAFIGDELDFIETHIRDALENSRKITYELSPPILYQLGIVEAINWLLESLEKTYKIKFQLKTNLFSVPLSETKSIILYRSVQEVLTNAIKYAKASLIEVSIKKNETEVAISVVDNGNGFDTSKLSKVGNHSGSGFGLFTIQERINNLSGTFTITSKIDSGTTVNISIPLSQK